jgi:hypothetical protein
VDLFFFLITANNFQYFLLFRLILLFKLREQRADVKIIFLGFENKGSK